MKLQRHGQRALSAALLLLLVAGCGSRAGVRQPTARERAGISAGAKRELQPFLRTRRLHARVQRIVVSRRDPHFARIKVKPVNVAGQQVSETVDMVLVQAAGEWIPVLEGTDLSSVCLHPSPRAVVDLVCHAGVF